MKSITKILLARFINLNFIEIKKTWNDLGEITGNSDVGKIEEAINVTPIFTADEMLNFALYCCENNISSKSQKEMEEQLEDWMEKIK